MKKKILISGMALVMGLMAFTFVNNSENADSSALFVSSDNIALAQNSGWICKYCGDCANTCSTIDSAYKHIYKDIDNVQ